jgi:hypothetical protein
MADLAGVALRLGKHLTEQPAFEYTSEASGAALLRFAAVC